MNLADALNLHCACQTLSPHPLREQLERAPALAGLAGALAVSHPTLFSGTAVFVVPDTLERMARAIAAIERVAARPTWQAAALADVAPPAARELAGLDFGPAGVFMGYDFHLSDDGPRLIEINTNAGGAFLNAALARAHRACCGAAQAVFEQTPGARSAEDAFVAMFRAEWRAQRGDAPLTSVLIADDDPAAQYLAPEFALAREQLAAQGWRVAVGDAREGRYDAALGAYFHPALPGTRVDLVYNRTTDFGLTDPAHAALRQAYAHGATVLTPHPRAHALLADKRNLVRLSDDAWLAAIGASAADRADIAAAVPRTVNVDAADADALWAERRHWFFKPWGGFGSRATYRGDKLTRRVWGEITAGGYVAQALVPPSERLVSVDGQPQRLKVDLRVYTYRAQPQLVAARVWAGQTTNFRTPGGGFAPVALVPPLSVDTGVCKCLPSGALDS
jgi:hypothetical protein